MKRRLVSSILTVGMAALLMTGCSGSDSGATDALDGKEESKHAEGGKTEAAQGKEEASGGDFSGILLVQQYRR